MTTSNELGMFNTAMDTIRRADPARVKKNLEAEIEASRREREARGERKRGRKAKVTLSASGHVSSAKD